MNDKLKEGDEIRIHTKNGAVHRGVYCSLHSGYVGLTSNGERIAIPIGNVEKIFRINKGKKR